MKNLHHHSKNEFQVERLGFFSDAVFAIAMTLLIIDIKVPELNGLAITDHNFLVVLFSLLPKFMGFIISFFIIGLYWFIHHRMFGFVINYSGKLIWLNLLFLFSIVLMPFTTAVYSEYSLTPYIQLVLPYAVYVFNISLTGFINYLMWGFIGNPSNGISEGLPPGDYLQKAKIRSLMLPIVFILSLVIVIFVGPIVGRFVLFLIPLFMSFVKNKKK